MENKDNAQLSSLVHNDKPVAAVPSANTSSLPAVPGVNITSDYADDTPPNGDIVGSQLAQHKPKLPIGVYIIAGWNLVGFIISFFNTSETSTVLTIAMLVDLLLGIGLLLRLETARKTMVWLSGLLVVLSMISLILLLLLQNRLQQDKAKYDNAIDHLSQQNLTEAEQAQLTTMQAQINSDQKKVGKALGVAYFQQGAAIVEGCAVIVYLTRPSVKQVFHELPQ